MFQPDKSPGGVPHRENDLSRLSGAIRAGIPMVEHARGNWCGCTLATAALALGFKGYAHEASQFIYGAFPRLGERSGLLDPRHGGFIYGGGLGTQIEALDRMWTREQVADWLEAAGL